MGSCASSEKSTEVVAGCCQLLCKAPDASSETFDEHELTWYFDTAARAKKIIQILSDLHELDVTLEETRTDPCLLPHEDSMSYEKSQEFLDLIERYQERHNTFSIRLLAADKDEVFLEPLRDVLDGKRPPITDGEIMWRLKLTALIADPDILY